MQRVSGASVTAGGQVLGSIGAGYLILLGIAASDTRDKADKLVQKIRKLRIFADANGKTNLSIEDVRGEVLVVSQFTLYADCAKGNRPSFIGAAPPEFAEEMYEYFLRACEGQFEGVERGSFGADMKVSLCNDGPFTVILEY